MKKNSEWLSIWQKKYAPEAAAETHVLDGFYALSADQYARLAGFFIDKLQLSGKDDILEIGCGAGAFLAQIKKYKTISGVDYSENAVSMIHRRLQGDFFIAEGSQLPFDAGRFDIVLCFSVFFYFKDLAYAKKVVEEMIRVLKPKGKIFIGDINDLAKKDFALKLRAVTGGPCQIESQRHRS